MTGGQHTVIDGVQVLWSMSPVALPPPEYACMVGV
jgi:hypothetical protein